jgi:transcriptional/translational regulatory protein YebC/TACO1
LGESGSVMYQFEQKGQIQIDLSKQEIEKEELEMAIIDSGAEDFEGDDLFFVYTNTKDLHTVKDSLESSGVKIESAEIIYQPKNQIAVTDVRDAEKVVKFIDNLEELDDVVGVHANFDISDEIAEQLS